MQNTISGWIELALTIVIAAVSIMELTALIKAASASIVPSQSDKTALAVEWIGELPGVQSEIDGKWHANLTNRTVMDVVMSGIVSDAHLPFPRSYKVNNTPVVNLTDAWILAKYQNVLKLWRKNGTWNFWSLQNNKIQNIDFVSSLVDGDYMHITTE